MAVVKCLSDTIFLKKSMDFQENFFNRCLFGKTVKIVYKKSILKEWIRSYFLHGSTFCVGIYMSVSKPSIYFENRLFQLSGGTSCLFTISIWQVIEEVYVVYSSWFSWKCELLLRFNIGGPRIFPRVAATMISKRFVKLRVIVKFWIL